MCAHIQMTPLISTQKLKQSPQEIPINLFLEIISTCCSFYTGIKFTVPSYMTGNTLYFFNNLLWQIRPFLRKKKELWNKLW